MVDTVDSNLTGLRYAEEQSLKRLPVDPVWRAMDPNGYSDFGGEVTTVTRSPINDSRQRRKGSAVGINASGGFDTDLTMNGMTRLMRGFLFADAREKPTTDSVNTPAPIAIAAAAAATKEYSSANMPVFTPGALIFVAGFAAVANNGLKNVVTSPAGAVTVSQNVVNDAAPGAAARIHQVGHQFAASDISFTLNGRLVRMNSAAFDLTTLGVIPGEWVFVGGDAAGNRMSDTSYGFARVNVVTAGYIEFDKTDFEPAAETGAGKTLQLFYGILIKNELKALIKTQSYSLERSLGEDDDGEMAEYLDGAIANELSIQMPQEDKITVDLGFVAMDSVQHSGLQGLRPGIRIDVNEDDECLNTSKDFARIKLSVVDPTDANPIPLAAFLQDLNLTINNNASITKALAVFGGIGATVGMFEVDGTTQAYFNGVAAAQAVRASRDVTLDVIVVKDNEGMLFDLPQITLGNARNAVEPDQKIMVPLDTAASRSKFGNTLTFQQFRYLPDIAASGV